MIKNKVDPGILFLLFGIHLTLPLTVNGATLVPEIIVSSFLLVTGYILRAVLNVTALLSLSAISIVLILTILLSPDWALHYVAHIRSALNLIFSLVITVAFLIYLNQKQHRTDVAFNVRIFVIVAIVASIMEMLVPFFTHFVDTFRYFVFPIDRIYTADLRDAEVYGFIRPTFFGNEPSYLGITLATFTMCLWVCSVDLRKQIIALTLFVVGMLIVRSPTAVAIWLMFPVIFLIDSAHRKLPKWQVIVLFLLPFFLFLFSSLVLDVFGVRIDKFLAGEDNSTDIRLLKPVDAMRLSISRSPLVGVGVGGRDKLTDDMLRYSDWSHHTDYVFNNKRISNFFSTGLFLIFTETGAMALVILYLIFVVFRSVLTQIRLYEFILCFILMSVTMGGWSHPRLWLLVGLLLFFFNQKRLKSCNKEAALVRGSLYKLVPMAHNAK
jgi:hypothetical protein